MNQIMGLYVKGKTFLPSSEAMLERPTPVTLSLEESGMCIQKHVTMKDFSSLTEDNAEQLLHDTLFFEYAKIRELQTRKMFRERFISFLYEGRAYYLQYLSDADGSGKKRPVAEFLTELEQLVKTK